MGILKKRIEAEYMICYVDDEQTQSAIAVRTKKHKYRVSCSYNIKGIKKAKLLSTKLMDYRDAKAFLENWVLKHPCGCTK